MKSQLIYKTDSPNHMKALAYYIIRRYEGRVTSPRPKTSLGMYIKYEIGSDEWANYPFLNLTRMQNGDFCLFEEDGRLLDDSYEEFKTESRFLQAVHERLHTEPKPNDFKISDEYTAQVRNNGDVQVGCQRVSAELLDKIHARSVERRAERSDNELPAGVPPLKDGWIYAGEGALEHPSELMSRDVAHWDGEWHDNLEWDDSGWSGCLQRGHHAVRKGSAIAKANGFV